MRWDCPPFSLRSNSALKLRLLPSTWDVLRTLPGVKGVERKEIWQSELMPESKLTNCKCVRNIRRKSEMRNDEIFGEQIKVLVADDSAVYRKLVEQTLSESEYTVMFAKSGREAMDIFAKHRPSLVITDWMMPDFSGIELCENIRQQFQESYTYIIILTGMSHKSEVVKGLKSGADDYLTKPFDQE